MGNPPTETKTATMPMKRKRSRYPHFTSQADSRAPMGRMKPVTTRAGNVM
jgi:hypothetical protein